MYTNIETPETTSSNASALEIVEKNLSGIGKLDQLSDNHWLIRQDGQVKIVRLFPTSPKVGEVSADHKAYSLESFIKYVNRHETANTEIWISRANDAPEIIAVIDGNQGATIEDETRPRIGLNAHQVQLWLEFTADWKVWKANDRQWMTQANFAELLDGHGRFVASPSAAELLEIAQTVKSTSNAEFGSAQRLADGSVSLTYKQEAKTTAGKAGQLTIPQTLKLKGQVIAQCPATVEFTARLRYRIREQKLSFMVLIDYADEALTAILDGMATDLEKSVKAPVYVGTPSYEFITENTHCAITESSSINRKNTEF